MHGLVTRFIHLLLNNPYEVVANSSKLMNITGI